MNAYNFSTTASELADAFTNGMLEPKGDLKRALQLAKDFECDITLTDESGFAKGSVKANGDYQLR